MEARSGACDGVEDICGEDSAMDWEEAERPEANTASEELHTA